MLAHVWERVTHLLDSRTRAEEEICYLAMFGPGSPLGEWRRDAVPDHDDIREAIEEALLQPAGSALWWGAARAVLAASADHLDREEREMLVSWLPRSAARCPAPRSATPAGAAGVADWNVLLGRE